MTEPRKRRASRPWLRRPGARHLSTNHLPLTVTCSGIVHALLLVGLIRIADAPVGAGGIDLLPAISAFQAPLSRNTVATSPGSVQRSRPVVAPRQLAAPAEHLEATRSPEQVPEPAMARPFPEGQRELGPDLPSESPAPPQDPQDESTPEERVARPPEPSGVIEQTDPNYQVRASATAEPAKPAPSVARAEGSARPAATPTNSAPPARIEPGDRAVGTADAAPPSIGGEPARVLATPMPAVEEPAVLRPAKPSVLVPSTTPTVLRPVEALTSVPAVSERATPQPIVASNAEHPPPEQNRPSSDRGRALAVSSPPAPDTATDPIAEGFPAPSVARERTAVVQPAPAGTSTPLIPATLAAPAIAPRTATVSPGPAG